MCRSSGVRLLAAAALLLTARGAAQDSSVVTEGFPAREGMSVRKAVATGAAGGILAASLVESYYAWWKDATGPFTFRSEGWFSNQRGIDKAGHFYTSYLHFRAFRDILLWGGYGSATATAWAAGMSAVFALSVEVGDGFSEYAFDYQDLLFNAAGLGYGLLQTEVPALRNFTFKWSYVPAGGYRFPPRFTRHYDAHTYWLTARVDAFLPRSVEPYWPDFLRLAFGYSVADGGTRSEWVIGLDLDLEAFGPCDPDLLLPVRLLNAYHFPAPAVKFTDGKRAEFRVFHLQ